MKPTAAEQQEYAQLINRMARDARRALFLVGRGVKPEPYDQRAWAQLCQDVLATARLTPTPAHRLEHPDAV